MPPQKKDLAQLLRKADITVTPTAVTATSPEVLALIGDVADYVKPSIRVERPQGGGQSMGANAQRKRADRSGRPTEGGQRSRSGSGQGSSQGSRSGSRDGGSSQGSRSGGGQSYSTGYSDNSSQGSSAPRRETSSAPRRDASSAPRRASSGSAGQATREASSRDAGSSRGGYGDPVGMPRRDRSERPPRASRPQGR